MPFFSDVQGGLDEFNQTPAGNAVGELSELLKSDSKAFQFPLPNSVQRRLHHQSNMPIPMECYLEVSRKSIYSIVDAVRNTILQWALQLDQEGILGEGMRFTPEEKAIAMTNQTIHIGNFQGILGNVDESTVNQSLTMSVEAGDFGSLQQKLGEAGIASEDLLELKSALETDPKPKAPSEFGPKVSAWIGTMMTKAASGAWKVTVDTAAKLIPAAIAAYYGFEG